MAITVKTQEDILAKLNIYELNEMQQKAISTIDDNYKHSNSFSYRNR